MKEFLAKKNLFSDLFFLLILIIFFSIVIYISEFISNKNKEIEISNEQYIYLKENYPIKILKQYFINDNKISVFEFSEIEKIYVNEKKHFKEERMKILNVEVERFKNLLNN